MRKLKLAAVAALLCSGLAVSAAQASTDTPVDQCRELAKQVKQALDNNQQSQNYDDAIRARRSGNDFCVHGLYQPGIANYQAALKLLGGDSQAKADSQTKTD